MSEKKLLLRFKTTYGNYMYFYEDGTYTRGCGGQSWWKIENGEFYCKHNDENNQWLLVNKQTGGSTDLKLLQELPDAFNKMIERDLLGEDSE